MMNQKKDHFLNKAKEWDQGNTRVKNARNISEKILSKIKLEGSEHIMDFGAGTGLLSESIAPHIYKLTAVDYSEAMLKEFCKKEWPCETEALNIDLSQATLDHTFDGIISSMTLHHIADIPGLFSKFHTLLKKEGFVALADLEKEDGSFHNDNSGVEHFGFDRAFISGHLKNAGFSDISFVEANVISKEINGKMKDFPIFMVYGRKK